MIEKSKYVSKMKIFGDEWTVFLSSRDKPISRFDFIKRIIEIDPIARQDSMVHELLEAIMVKNLYRFYAQEGSMEHMFVFDHSGLTRISEQFSQILKDNKMRFLSYSGLKELKSKKRKKVFKKKK